MKGKNLCKRMRYISTLGVLVGLSESQQKQNVRRKKYKRRLPDMSSNMTLHDGETQCTELGPSRR